MLTFGRIFRSLDCALGQRMDQALSGMDLTFSQGHIMGYLAHRDTPPCAKDIEEEFHLSHPTVSGLLSRLEKKSFLEFRPDERDGRCKRIYVLPKGMDCHERIFHVILENEKRVVQGFTREEKKQFAALLTRAVENMGGQSSFQFEEEETNE